jgi:hypothetical protein
MQSRLSQGPHITLGVAELATAGQVRAAFLELTKQYHPARFGRLSSELQRMSNEVFLGIKSAHDAMLRALGAPLKPTRGGIQPIQAEGSSRMPQVRPTPQPPARAIGTAPPTAPTRPSQPLPKVPSQDHGYRGGPEAVARRLTPPFGMPVTAPQPPQAPPQRPTPQRLGSPPMRAHDPLNPDTIRHAGVQPAAPAFDEQRALMDATQLLQTRNWGAARQALHALAARVPQSKPYRALLCYARGREAQQTGRTDDAALEFQRSLQLDPNLAPAKQALAEVQRRR